MEDTNNGIWATYGYMYEIHFLFSITGKKEKIKTTLYEPGV